MTETHLGVVEKLLLFYFENLSVHAILRRLMTLSGDSETETPTCREITDRGVTEKPEE